MKPRILPLATALTVLLAGTGNTFAQSKSAPRADTREQALAEAQADLARAAARVAELSKQRALHGLGEMRRPVLGVLLAPDTQAGVRIAGVTPGSGASKAGLKSGDRILSVDGRQVLGDSGELRMQNLRKLLGRLDAGKKTRIGYARDGRAATVGVTPTPGRRVFVWNGDGPDGKNGAFVFSTDDFDFDPGLDAMPDIASEIRKELIRIGPLDACKDDACRAPMLLSAFRWNGLNLASVDAQLGRYFGTDHGVLVLSNGELDGLRAGDVIQRIEGKPVDSPREAMAALRGRPDGAKVAITYLRDRKTGSTQVTVPELLPLPIPPRPPAPPAPPKPPKAPPPPPSPVGIGNAVVPHAPPRPPAPPSPPAAPGIPAHGFVLMTEG